MVKSLSVYVFVPWTILVPLNRVSHRNAKICWGNSSYTQKHYQALYHLQLMQNWRWWVTLHITGYHRRQNRGQVPPTFQWKGSEYH